MAKTKRKKNTSKKPALTPEMRRRRNAARAKLASAAGVFALCAVIILLIKIGGKTEIPLDVDASGYEWLEAEVADTEQLVTGENGTPSAPLDMEIASVAIINPKLTESYPIDMNIRSEYAIVYDVEADRVLYAKNAEEKCYPASTTKIMSASVTLKNAPEDMIFTAGDELDMVNPGSSLAMLNKGCQLDLSMIIDAMMLPSGNDASYCAAANVGRILGNDENLSAAQAVQNFVDEMNRTAKAIGCENTHFANPDGFHHDEHYTTVKDMLKIALYAENFDMLNASVRKPSRYVTFLTGEQISWENSNKLLHDYSDCYYMYATGMKTGMTDQAGHCVVATAERFNHQIICIVFGAEAGDIRWNDTIALLDAAFVDVRTRTGG